MLFMPVRDADVNRFSTIRIGLALTDLVDVHGNIIVVDEKSESLFL